jgi:adenylate cyclase
MPPEPVVRKLAAILAADVVGYSRLIGADEEGTLKRLAARRKQLIDPKIAEYQGRVVKLMGDGILIEFPSAVAALRCAIDVQRAIAERCASDAKDRRIEYRMGLHQGDIVVEEGDILGDASMSQRDFRRWQSQELFACRSGFMKTLLAKST